MNFLDWLVDNLLMKKPKYNPQDDELVQELNQQAKKLRRQASVIRRARMQGREWTYEEMFGRDDSEHRGEDS